MLFFRPRKRPNFLSPFDNSVVFMYNEEKELTLCDCLDIMCLRARARLTWSHMMAEQKKSEELSVLEREWLKQSLATQRKVIVRSRSNERAGSEIWELRGRELAQLDLLISRFS